MLKIKPLLLMGLCVVLLTGCRGNFSDKPAVHLNPNLDVQPKVTAQTMPITPPAETVPWGSNIENRADALAEDSAYYRGQTASGAWVNSIPVTVNEALLKRGQERYDIYCSSCHDRAGTGNGPVVKLGFTPPPVMWDARVLTYTDGELYNIVTHGIRNMPAHDKQIPVADRWAIVAYVRALQTMHTATLKDVPETKRSAISK